MKKIKINRSKKIHFGFFIIFLLLFVPFEAIFLLANYPLMDKTRNLYESVKTMGNINFESYIGGYPSSVKNKLLRIGKNTYFYLTSYRSGKGYILVVNRDDYRKILHSFIQRVKVYRLYKYKLFPFIFIDADLDEITMVIDSLAKKPIIIIPNLIYNLSTTEKQYVLDANPTLINNLDIGAHYFWKDGYDGSGIKIGLIDTGVNCSHPDLQDKVLISKSFVLKKYGYDDDEYSGMDGNGHGTFVASIICGSGKGNRLNGTGVAPGAVIMNARVFPSGKVTFATLAGILAALEWLTIGPDGREFSGDEADIINMSIGGPPEFVDVLKMAVDTVIKRGFIVVTAAGNRGHNGVNSMSVTSPGTSLYAISVGGAEFNGSEVSSFSSIGPTSDLIVKPDIVAPSKAIAANVGGGYRALYGSSLSAAYVSGSIALILDFMRKNNITLDHAILPGYIKYVILASAKKITEYDELWCGAGYINLKGSIELLKELKRGERLKRIITLPSHIPIGHLKLRSFFPYRKYVFRGENYTLKITLLSTFTDDYINIKLDGNISHAVSLLSKTQHYINNTMMILPVIFRVKRDIAQGFYLGVIILSTREGINHTIPIRIHVKEEIGKMMIWLKLSPIIENFKYAIYREFVLLAEEFYIYTDAYWGNLTRKVAEKYKIIFIPNAFPAMRVYSENGSIERVFYPNITESELEILKEFIENKGIVILTISFPVTNNFHLANKIASIGGMIFRRIYIGTQSTPALVVANKSIILNRGVSFFLHYGCGLEIVYPYVNVLADFEGLPTSALYLGKKGGLLVMSSLMYLSNYGFASEYKNNVLTFASNFFEFAMNESSSIKCDRTDIIRGEAINLTVYLGNYYNNAKLFALDLAGLREISQISIRNTSLNYQIESRVAGSLYIGLKLIRENYSVCRQILLNIIPRNTSKPVIIFDENNSLKKLGDKDYLNISCRIIDDEGLLPPEYFKVIAFLPELNYRFVIHNNKNFELSIWVSRAALEEMARYYKTKKLRVSFRVTIIDIDLNNVTYALIIDIIVKYEESILGISKEDIKEFLLIVAILATCIAIAYYLNKQYK